MRTFTKQLQEQLTPQEALEMLKEGNKRFVQNLKTDRNLLEQVNTTGSGQYPFAIILSCIDSRVPAELVFDQGIGDIFSVRIAGNVVNEDILGSMEFACKVAGSKFIMVLGHTRCGAIKGACDHVEMGNLSTLLSKIEPSVEQEKETKDNRSSKNATFVENVSKINVQRSVQEILNRSNILIQMVEEGKIGIGGAMYDVTSGSVEVYDDTLLINQPERTQSA